MRIADGLIEVVFLQSRHTKGTPAGLCQVACTSMMLDPRGTHFEWHAVNAALPGLEELPERRSLASIAGQIAVLCAPLEHGLDKQNACS